MEMIVSKNKLTKLSKIFDNNKNLNFLQDTPINSLTNSKMVLKKDTHVTRFGQDFFQQAQ